MVSACLLRLSVGILLVLPSAGCRTTASSAPEPAVAATSIPEPAVTLQFDYAGAEAMLDALEADSLSDADIDRMLAVAGVRAVLDNVTRFIPDIGITEFRAAMKAFAPERTSSPDNRAFQIAETWERRARIRALLGALRADEDEMMRRTLAVLEPYKPNTGSLAIQVYFVAGGVSDGFVFDDRPEPALYANLTRAIGDLDGALVNMTHEAYHVMQKAAQRRAPGLATVADDLEGVPPVERFFAVTLLEGTASYVVDPRAFPGSGENIEATRERYHRNLEPQRIAENFALFDAILADLQDARITWDEAYERGFAGHNDARMYFVGYELTKAMVLHCGAECLRRSFERPPIEFFRQYVALAQEHAELRRFAPQSERLILGAT